MNLGADYRLRPLSIREVTVNDRFWKPRLDVNRKITLPQEYRLCQRTGRLDVWRLKIRPDGQVQAHPFWDSDVAKWIEAAAYSLAVAPDPGLERRIDRIVALMERAQEPDGYLNSWVILRNRTMAKLKMKVGQDKYGKPYKRWSNLRDQHELYCAGHLMEAAVAYYAATGKRKFLELMGRYADCIAKAFGRGRNQRRGYCGHPEIELALVKLHRATGLRRYLELARYFIDERGRQPCYFDLEAQARGEDPGKNRYDYSALQAHRPLREQRSVEGHAVRAMYLLAGAADVCRETRDASLWAACRRLWQNVVKRRMYITGGVGSARQGERFTCDYDLPNETAYAETCAAIGLVFLAHRLLQIDPDREYADVMERALYNGVLSGVALDGKRFFYSNRLAVYPPHYDAKRNVYISPENTGGHVAPSRREWFSCACCPPNVARLLASFGQYVYSQNAREAYVHLFAQGGGTFSFGGRTVDVFQETDYPWGEKVTIRVAPRAGSAGCPLILAVRIPGWCRTPTLAVNGCQLDLKQVVRQGYARIRRVWQKGDRVELGLPMPVERMEAHPRVRQDSGRVALQRGPIVYCLEQIDNGRELNEIVLPRDSRLKASRERALFGGIPVITGRAWRVDARRWRQALYLPAGTPHRPVVIKAVPYCLWNNRAAGEMLVWIRTV